MQSSTVITKFASAYNKMFAMFNLNDMLVQNASERRIKMPCLKEAVDKTFGIFKSTLLALTIFDLAIGFKSVYTSAPCA